MVVFRLSTEEWPHRIASTSIRFEAPAYVRNSGHVRERFQCVRTISTLLKWINKTCLSSDESTAMRHSFGWSVEKLWAPFSTGYVKLVSASVFVNRMILEQTHLLAVACSYRAERRSRLYCVLLRVVHVDPRYVVCRWYSFASRFLFPFVQFTEWRNPRNSIILQIFVDLETAVVARSPLGHIIRNRLPTASNVPKFLISYNVCRATLQNSSSNPR